MWQISADAFNSGIKGLFRLPALRRLEEKHLLLHDGVVLEHAERSVRARPDYRAVVARQGHGDQPDGHRAGFRWLRVSAADLRVWGRVCWDLGAVRELNARSMCVAACGILGVWTHLSSPSCGMPRGDAVGVRSMELEGDGKIIVVTCVLSHAE